MNALTDYISLPPPSRQSSYATYLDANDAEAAYTASMRVYQYFNALLYHLLQADRWACFTERVCVTMTRMRQNTRNSSSVGGPRSNPNPWVRANGRLFGCNPRLRASLSMKGLYK
eukprot:5538760-Prymnesium_polylepis.1